MIYLKSIGTGLLAVIVAGVLILAFIYVIYKPYGTNAIAFSPENVARSLKTWIIILSSFAIGFVWEFRRATK